MDTFVLTSFRLKAHNITCRPSLTERRVISMTAWRLENRSCVTLFFALLKEMAHFVLSFSQKPRIGFSIFVNVATTLGRLRQTLLTGGSPALRI